MPDEQTFALDGEGATPKRKRRPKSEQPPHTSKQRLSAIIKRVRDKLREDAGISTDAERLPQLTWMLFLKILDDHEVQQEEEHGERYEPIIKPPYRWRDWACPKEIQAARKGDELTAFVNNELFEYLRKLSGPSESDLRTVTSKIFRGTYNLVRSGYILREVLETLGGINFNSSDDVHLVSHFYETMLKEMRDTSGKSGEFYTPRPLVRLIIDRLNPKLGERILDPACGTCGFLAEAYERLKPEARTPAARRSLHASLLGVEKKTMPYLLGVVNLLLHGIEQPNLDERNTLTMPISSIRDDDRVDVIATNPPFGGEEEEGVLYNFPQGMRTKETAILFFQHIMAKLKRPGGRCGVVLPNGFLFGTGVAAEVKQRLLRRFNLHTVVRLPEGVFQPYTPIPTNVLFFEACDPAASDWCTQEIWYYEHSLPEDRKYSKTKPMDFDEFRPLFDWWDDR
ncbi:MAG: SAM-dependent DNA methyltransferase, partial [Singulisphaera sp.]|nr:SAM-dependent DNA methyltransferase [Singulisphaera sp.]